MLCPTSGSGTGIEEFNMTMCIFDISGSMIFSVVAFNRTPLR